MLRFVIPLLTLAAALMLAAAETPKKKVPAEPKSFAEKERIAADMKKIAKQLDVKCEYCHADAERAQQPVSRAGRQSFPRQQWHHR